MRIPKKLTAVVRIILIQIFVCVTTVYANAQAKRDSLSILHSPTKATILSAVLPGAGQYYNKKYWKIPVIYAGFTALGYFVVTNNEDYKIYKKAYKYRLDGDESTSDEFVGIYTDEDLSTLKNYYRRNRDLSVIGMAILYVLNVVDASVDAHLFYFDVNEELSLRVSPGYNYGLVNGPTLGLNIQF